MSKININIEKSCSKHPRLKAGLKLPRNGQTRVSQQRLFSLGTLCLQDTKKESFASYRQTMSRWNSLQGLYADYLTFQAQQLTTDAEGEILTKLSEVVGVALGMAAMCAQFDINLNRFTRFRATGSSMRRVDFEYYAGGKRFFHETKGTTYETSVQKMCNDIADQKKQTLLYVKTKTARKITPIMVSGCTGSVALYRHATRNNFSSLITLIDPPPPAGKGTRVASEGDELSSVLRYYQNYYSVTHFKPQNVPSIAIDAWLRSVISDLDEGRTAPASPPSNLRVRARATENGPRSIRYGGSYFDARLGYRSVANSESFEAATRRSISPVTFLGVSEEITEMIQTCRWDDLLSYRNDDSRRTNSAALDVSESGIISRRIDPEVVNAESRKSFGALRKRWLSLSL